MKITEVAEAFLDYELYERRCSPKTHRLYRYYLDGFLRHLLLHEPSAAVVSRRDVSAFMQSLARRGISDTVQFKWFNHLRWFFRWACEDGRFTENPMRHMKAPLVSDKVKVVLDKAAVLQLLAAVAGSGALNATRDETVYATIYYAGLRAGEVCGAQAADVELENHRILVRGKGGRIRYVPIHPDLAPRLRRWLRIRDKSTPWLFPSHPGRGGGKWGQLDVWRVEKALRAVYVPLAGLQARVTPHTLRRSLATRLNRQKASLNAIREILGHRSLKTTQVYIGVSSEDLRATIRMA